MSFGAGVGGLLAGCSSGMGILLGFGYGCSSQEVIQEGLGQDVYIEEIGIEVRGNIELAANENAYLGSVWRFFVKDASFVFMDGMLNRVLEFDTEGNFRQQIGRIGTEPGEYTAPFPPASALDRDDNLYVYDSNRAITNIYNEKGEFVAELNRDKQLGYTDKLCVEPRGHLLQLTFEGEEGEGIATLRKFDAQLKEIYATALSGPETDTIVLHMSGFSGFCYSPELNRIYYLLPCGYRIKEIDAETGRIQREFGEKPIGYRPLDEKFYNLGIMEDPADFRPIQESTTFVYGGMYLLDPGYLLVGHGNYFNDISWYVYDLRDFDKVYTINSQGRERLDMVRKRLAVRDSFLYLYSPPEDEELSSSNGRIEILALDLDRR